MHHTSRKGPEERDIPAKGLKMLHTSRKGPEEQDVSGKGLS